MDLQCLQMNLKGQKVQVNGTIYDVGEDMLVKNVKDADAAKLLKAPAAWRKPVVRTPVAANSGKNPEPVVAPEVIAPEVEAEKAPEWPDPKESMELDYLHKMADAYDVKFNDKTSKKMLVKLIHEAMYE